jgi:serine/threonine-protein phosphatase 2A activator
LKNADDIRRFERSQAYARLLVFIRALSLACRGAKLSDGCFVSPFVNRLLEMLLEIERWIEQYPPSQHRQARYGNPAFRDWHRHLTAAACGIVDRILPDEKKEAVIELTPYLCQSFGNATRIDYGTGHENMFVAFLTCLSELGLILQEDHKSLALRVFPKYVELMRKLQLRYRCVSFLGIV